MNIKDDEIINKSIQLVRLVCLLTTIENLRHSMIEMEEIWSKGVDMLEVNEHNSLNDLLISLFVNLTSKKSNLLDKFGERVIILNY